MKLKLKHLTKHLYLHADHELNASTFTARVCVATLSDVYSGVTAAIGALKRTTSRWSKRTSYENVN